MRLRLGRRSVLVLKLRCHVIPYSTLKALNADTGRCVRAGCSRQSLDDNLHCGPCRADQRRRNKRSYMRLHAKKSRQLRLPIGAFVRNRCLTR
jgi:hypothetical protein